MSWGNNAGGWGSEEASGWGSVRINENRDNENRINENRDVLSISNLDGLGKQISVDTIFNVVTAAAQIPGEWDDHVWDIRYELGDRNAHVKMKSIEASERAMNKLHKSKVYGRQIFVEFEKGNSNLFAHLNGSVPLRNPLFDSGNQDTQDKHNSAEVGFGWDEERQNENGIGNQPSSDQQKQDQNIERSHSRSSQPYNRENMRQKQPRLQSFNNTRPSEQLHPPSSQQNHQQDSWQQNNERNYGNGPRQFNNRNNRTYNNHSEQQPPQFNQRRSQWQPREDNNRWQNNRYREEDIGRPNSRQLRQSDQHFAQRGTKSPAPWHDKQRQKGNRDQGHGHEAPRQSDNSRGGGSSSQYGQTPFMAANNSVISEVSFYESQIGNTIFNQPREQDLPPRGAFFKADTSEKPPSKVLHVTVREKSGQVSYVNKKEMITKLFFENGLNVIDLFSKTYSQGINGDKPNSMFLVQLATYEDAEKGISLFNNTEHMDRLFTVVYSSTHNIMVSNEQVKAAKTKKHGSDLNSSRASTGSGENFASLSMEKPSNEDIIADEGVAEDKSTEKENEEPNNEIGVMKEGENQDVGQVESKNENDEKEESEDHVKSHPGIDQIETNDETESVETTAVESKSKVEVANSLQKEANAEESDEIVYDSCCSGDENEKEVDNPIF